MARATLRTFEATFREAASVAPRGGRVYRGVTIIKAGKGNAADRHFYPSHVLQEAVEKGQFEKLKAYADHPSRLDETIQPERTIRDMVGLYSNVRFVREGERGGRVVGDLQVFKSQKWLSDLVDELVASDAADKIGISINGEGDTEAKDIAEAGGRVNEVLNFRRLHSADIVTEAGAGGGFHTLLESARVARKERTMTKTELLAKIAEAAKSGNAEEVTTLSQHLSEADDEAPAEEKCAECDSKAKSEDDEDLEESAAPAEDAAAPEDEDDDEAEEEAEPEAEPVAEASSMRAKHAKGTKVHEAMNAKGGATKGGGSFTKKSSGRGQAGRRYAEAETPDADVESLREANEALTAENQRLKKQISLQERRSNASKVVKGIKGLSPEGQKELAVKLVRECNTMEDMKREAGFYTRLLESAVENVRESFSDDLDDDIEGLPSRIREGFGGVETPDALLQELGLPVKH